MQDRQTVKLYTPIKTAMVAILVSYIRTKNSKLIQENLMNISPIS